MGLLIKIDNNEDNNRDIKSRTCHHEDEADQDDKQSFNDDFSEFDPAFHPFHLSNQKISVNSEPDKLSGDATSEKISQGLLVDDNSQVSKKDNEAQLTREIRGEFCQEDGGYGWVIVICASLVLMMYGANYIAFSIYITDFTEVFDKPQAYISIMGSLDVGLTQFTSLPAGAFVSLYGCRRICMIGLLINALGLLLSAFMNNFYALLFTFGILKGVGIGMVYIPCSLIVQQYITKRRTLAVAFSSGGLSIGGMAFAPIHRLLIRHYGWRGGLIFFSAIVMQCVVFAALMRPISSTQRKKTTNEREGVNKIAKVTANEKSESSPMKWLESLDLVWIHLRKALTLSHMRDPKFVLFILMKPLGMAGTIGMHKFSVARASYMGVNKILASLLATFNGSGSAGFRYIGGLLVVCSGVNKLGLYSSCTGIAGLAVMAYVMTGSHFYNHALGQFIYGSITGTAECVFPTVAADLFGLERLPSTMGWIMAFMGIMSSLWMPFYGWLYDMTSSYTLPFVVGGSVQVLAGFSGFGVMLLKYRDTNRKQNKNIVTT